MPTSNTADLPPSLVPPATALVHTRYGCPADAVRVRKMLDRCSPDSLYRRFHAPTVRVADTSLRQLLAPLDGWSVLAERRGEVVALVCVGELSPVDLEVGILVEDAHQHRGIGAQLLREVAGDAHGRGYERLHCLTQPDNARVAATAGRAGLLSRSYREDGVLHVDIQLA